MNTPDDMEINPRWINLDQAKLYCPIGKKSLIRLIQEGKIKGGKQHDNGKHPWFIDRLSLDKYMQSMIDPNEAEQKAVEIMQRMI